MNWRNVNISEATGLCTPILTSMSFTLGIASFRFLADPISESLNRESWIWNTRNSQIKIQNPDTKCTALQHYPLSINLHHSNQIVMIRGAEPEGVVLFFPSCISSTHVWMAEQVYLKCFSWQYLVLVSYVSNPLNACHYFWSQQLCYGQVNVEEISKVKKVTFNSHWSAGEKKCSQSATAMISTLTATILCKHLYHCPNKASIIKFPFIKDRELFMPSALAINNRSKPNYLIIPLQCVQIELPIVDNKYLISKEIAG